MTGWPDLAARLKKADVAGIVAALAGLDDAARRELAAPLRQYERRLRQGPVIMTGWRNWWELHECAGVAAAGVLPRSQLVPLLGRIAWGMGTTMGARARRPDTLPVAAAARVLADRGVTWVPALVDALAERMSARDTDQRHELVMALLDRFGLEPPASEGFAVNWIKQVGDDLERDVRRSPAWASLVSRGVLADGFGSALRWSGAPARLAALAQDGVLDRAAVLDACVARLQRGGQRSDLDGVRALHDALAPTGDEVLQRVPDYLAMLPGTAGSVAGLAHRMLREADQKHPLDPDVVLAAARSVFARPEKGLARDQLSWLDELAARPGTDVAAVLGVAAAVFHRSEAADLQARALRVILKRAGKLTADGRSRLAEAAAVLPSDLRDRAAAELGVRAEGAAAPPQTTPLPELRVQAAALRPVGGVGELAEEVMALWAGPYEDPREPARLERVLEGLVRLAGRDGREALAEGLAPVLSALGWIHPGPPRYASAGHGSTLTPDTELGALVAAAVSVPGRIPVRAHLASLTLRPDVTDLPNWRGNLDRVQNWNARPTAALIVRLSELAVRIGYGPAAPLLSTPTSEDGRLDPDVLVARLEARDAGGESPWPHDLAQAVLRLPADGRPDLARRVRRLSLRQGEPLAAWLERGGMPAPEVELVERPALRPRTYDWAREPDESVPEQALVARCRPGAGSEDFRQVLTRPYRALFELDNPMSALFDSFSPWRTVWPSLLPSHREAVAVHAVLELARHTTSGRGAARVLPLLAESHGEVGPATLLALGYGLAASHADDRAAAVDALLILAGRRQLDHEAFGALLGGLVRRGALVVTRVVTALRDVARSGAWGEVWLILRAAIQAAQPAPDQRPANRLGDLVGLAAEAAEVVRPAGTISGLAALAERPGAGRLVCEARRLRRLLEASGGTGAA